MEKMAQMPNERVNAETEEFDLERLRFHMRLSVEEKLLYLEQLNELSRALMPESSQKIWAKLKEQGY